MTPSDHCLLVQSCIISSPQTFCLQSTDYGNIEERVCPQLGYTILVQTSCQQTLFIPCWLVCLVRQSALLESPKWQSPMLESPIPQGSLWPEANKKLKLLVRQPFQLCKLTQLCKLAEVSDETPVPGDTLRNQEPKDHKACLNL